MSGRWRGKVRVMCGAFAGVGGRGCGDILGRGEL